MKKFKLLIVFLVINFGGLAIGAWLMDGGPTSEWYTNLNQAPWTPPGWVFGFAWTTIMICFSIYLVFHFSILKGRKIYWLYAFQVYFNVIWNYFFFNLEAVLMGLFVIISLTVVIFYYFFKYKQDKLEKIRYLLLPYMIWLCIATSLNAYILFYN